MREENRKSSLDVKPGNFRPANATQASIQERDRDFGDATHEGTTGILGHEVTEVAPGGETAVELSTSLSAYCRCADGQELSPFGKRQMVPGPNPALMDELSSEIASSCLYVTNTNFSPPFSLTIMCQIYEESTSTCQIQRNEGQLQPPDKRRMLSTENRLAWTLSVKVPRSCIVHESHQLSVDFSFCSGMSHPTVRRPRMVTEFEI